MTISPYLVHSARRASISIQPTRPIIGIVANEQMRFAREITDGIRIEPSPPLEPLWKSIVAGALTALAIVIVIVVF